MTKIGLISDTHGWLDPSCVKYFAGCDEIWHAGDLGVIAIADKLKDKKIFKAVYGNIDGYDVRSEYPEILEWKCEDVKVLMLHICLLYTSPSPRDRQKSRMPSSA